MIKDVIKLITHDTPAEKVQREVDLLNEIKKCKRENESVESYDNLFEGKVILYVNQKDILSRRDNQQ